MVHSQTTNAHCRLTAHSSWGAGGMTKPSAGVRSSSSSETPGGGVKWKRWRREVKKRKSSIFARLSPRHALRPERAKRFRCLESGRVLECYSSLKVKVTCRKGQEGISLDEFTLLAEEMMRVESSGALPFVLIIQNRSKKRNHSSSLPKDTCQYFKTKLFTLYLKCKNDFTFLMKYPWKVTSRLVLWGIDMGTMLASLCTSWMTASEYGRFLRSSTRTWRPPTTLASSSWTLSAK